MIIPIFLLLLFLSSTSFGQDSTQKVLYSEANIVKFADFLFDQQYYDRAITEYNRYLFTNINAQENPSEVYLKLIKAHYALHHFDHVLRYFSKIKNDPGGLSNYNEAVHYNLAAYIHNDPLQFQDYVDYLKNTSLLGQSALRYTEVLSVINSLQNQRWDEANQVLATMQYNSLEKTNGNVSSLKALSKTQSDYQAQSPYVAGLLSAIIPGLGKIYSDRWIDGLYSFALVAGTAFLSYEGFEKQGYKSTKGWIFGSMSAFFYVGNIYGAHVAVKLDNQNFKTQLENEINFQLKIWTDL